MSWERCVHHWFFSLSSFLTYTFKDINFPSGHSFSYVQQNLTFLYFIIHFIIIQFQRFSTSIVISSLTHGLLGNIFLNFQTYRDCLVILLLLTSSITALIRKNTKHGVISNSNLIKFSFLYRCPKGICYANQKTWSLIGDLFLKLIWLIY